MDLELNDQSFLVTRFQELTEDVYMNIFSIPANHLRIIKNRAVVHCTSSDDGTGAWTCNKDPHIINCSHVEKARHVLQQHVRADINAHDPSLTEKMTYQGTINDLFQLKLCLKIAQNRVSGVQPHLQMNLFHTCLFCLQHGCTFHLTWTWALYVI